MANQIDFVFNFPSEEVAKAQLPEWLEKDGYWKGSSAVVLKVLTKLPEYEVTGSDPETGEPIAVLSSPAEYSPGFWVGISTANVSAINRLIDHPACIVALDRERSSQTGELVCLWINPALQDHRTPEERVLDTKMVEPTIAGSRYQWGSKIRKVFAYREF